MSEQIESDAGAEGYCRDQIERTMDVVERRFEALER